MYKDTFSVVNMAHKFLLEKVASGDRVIDGTAGQGNDTLFLAELVGKTGKVWAFDVQEKACQMTQEKLQENNIDWAQVICDSHINIANYVKEPIRAGIFNLGYLPGENHQVITKGESTVKAVQAMMALLQENGVILLVCYLGHPGGREEYNMIYAYLQNLAAKQWCVSEFSFVNKQNAPRIIIVSK